MKLAARRTSYRETLRAINLVAHFVARCSTLQTTLQAGRFRSKTSPFRQLSGNPLGAPPAATNAASVLSTFCPPFSFKP